MLALATLATGALARADAIWISSGGANALKLDNVKVTEIAAGRIAFNSAGRSSVRDLAQVARIQIDDEPALTAAEEALAAGKFDVATDQFRRATDTTTKPWLKGWSAQRLIGAAQRAGRFDAAVVGFIALVQIDPARAEPLKPPLPQGRSSFIATAIGDVNQALADARLQPAQRQLLQSFLLELQRAGGDAQAAAATAQQLQQSGAAAGRPADAGAASLAKVRLDAGIAAVQNKQFARAVEEINAVRALITEPRDQVQALYYLAEAQFGLAAPKNDPAALQDAALAFMRVVAHFKDAPAQQLPAAPPLVARSLLRTAEISERLNDRDGARALYEQVVQQHPTDAPAQTAAKAALQRLSAAPANATPSATATPTATAAPQPRTSPN